MRTGLIGERGWMATTVMAGVAAPCSARPCVTGTPRFHELGLPRFDELAFTGHDVADTPFVERAERRASPANLPEPAREDLLFAAVRPGR
ncbi:hypothetical protein C3Y87_00110 [Carbonactinospora thermoautotrophica]|uniref:hypothetical protein n=1 Tax=Carbonactinospora thermoautotrophica TaxID=1469144 RepID=UPI00226ED092|nr:hypothetical protein [Carbonactinospora thermoautotrophica]MCX9189846.1 hypothetical protein [Carbonactinospora thermoautotrophica]